MKRMAISLPIALLLLGLLYLVLSLRNPIAVMVEMQDPSAAATAVVHPGRPYPSPTAVATTIQSAPPAATSVVSFGPAALTTTLQPAPPPAPATARSGKAVHSSRQRGPQLTRYEKFFRAMRREERSDPEKMRAAVSDNKKDSRYYEVQDKLEKHLQETEGRKPRALIVGANNGVLADKLTPVIMAHDWEATLVEPVPMMFEELQANFAMKTGSPPTGVRFVNKAVTEAPREVTMAVDLGDGPAWNKGCSTIVNKSSSCRGFAKHEITVQGDSLANILGGDTFDIVQIDVEMYDEYVLGQLDKLAWRPKIISIETCSKFCREWFSANNFSLEWIHDAIGVAKDMLW